MAECRRYILNRLSVMGFWSNCQVYGFIGVINNDAKSTNHVPISQLNQDYTPLNSACL